MSDATLGLLFVAMCLFFWLYLANRTRAAYSRSLDGNFIEAVLLDSGLYPVTFVQASATLAWSVAVAVDFMGLPVPFFVHQVLIGLQICAFVLVISVFICGRPRFLVPTTDPDGFPFQMVRHQLGKVRHRRRRGR